MSARKILSLCAAGACLSAAFALAAQAGAPAPDRFDKLDANKDGKIVLEEFRTAFPNMNEAAFGVIDVNGDKGIDRAEWFEFMEGHAKGSMPGMKREGAPMNNIPGDPIIPPMDSADLPLMRPPDMN